MLFRRKSLLLLVSRLQYGFLGNLIQGLTIFFFFLLTIIKCTRLLMIAHGKSTFFPVLLLNNGLLNNLVRGSLMIKRFWAAMIFQEKSLALLILSLNYGVLDNVIQGCLIFVLSMIICIRTLTIFLGKNLFLPVLWLNYSL